MNVIVTAFGRPDALIVRASLTVQIAHRVAEAFTEAREERYALHDLLVSEFGDYTFRWYCIDMSHSWFDITFSDEANPRTLEFQGTPAAIAVADRAHFGLRLQLSELIKPGRLSPNEPHKYAIT